jgi:hypothetical protein
MDEFRASALLPFQLVRTAVTIRATQMRRVGSSKTVYKAVKPKRGAESAQDRGERWQERQSGIWLYWWQ